jgi:hypothetical protein
MEERLKVLIYKDLMALGKKYSVSPEEIVIVLRDMKPKYTKQDLNI